MISQEELKRIERRARAMLTSKEIPPHKQEVVRTLMNNRQLRPEDKYQAIIELVQSCPDKKVILYHDEGVKPEPAKKQKIVKADEAQQKAPELSAPTETSYYVDELHGKYRRLRLFRKRYLVHRNTRLGIGMRKRLVPSKNMLKVIKYLTEVQSIMAARLVVIMMEILKDPGVEDPVIFNYLRLMRKWMVESPLLQLKYDMIKWMERAQFDRELRSWVTWFFSFLRLEAEMRERIMAEVEKRLRTLDDVRKEDLIDGEPVSYRREKEKRNLDKEKNVYEYMMLLRSFLPLDAKQDCLLSKRLKHQFGIDGLAAFLLAAEEALVFQRPVGQEEVISHFGITAPFVNVVAWDYSREFLEKVGKDDESIRKKKRDSLRKDLEPYETLAMLLRLEDEGRSLLLRGVEDQWRYIDKKRHDAKLTYNENFMNFVDALLQYFKNLYVPLLDGSAVVFRDMGRLEHEGAIFTFNYFEDHLIIFNKILDEMHIFKTSNPTLVLGREEVKRLVKEEAGAQAHIGRFIRTIGDCFYLIGRELQSIYDMHRRWVAGRTQLTGMEPARESIKERTLNENDERGRPIPFNDCVIMEVKNGTALSKELAGKRVLEDSLYDGVFIRMNAFAYQVAHECMSEKLMRDLEERKNLLKKIEESGQQK
jgi:hypothetical protein